MKTKNVNIRTHEFNRTTDRQARRHATKRLDKLERLEAKLEMRNWK